MTLAIAGMSCGGCVAKVRTALGAIPGARVDAVAVGSATVSYDATRTTPATIAEAIHDAGFELVPAGASVAADATGVAVGDCCGGDARARKHRGG